MTRVILLERLKEFTENAVKNLRLPVKAASGNAWLTEDRPRPASGPLNSMPENSSAIFGNTVDIDIGLEPPPEWEPEPAVPEQRAAMVFLTRLPDLKSYTEKAPYILHQLVTCRDVHETGKQPVSTASIRSVFCVYHENAEEGGLLLLQLMERFRVELETQCVIGGQFRLDMKSGVETFIYPDADINAPFYLGEMNTVWWLPPVQRKDEIHGRIDLSYRKYG